MIWLALAVLASVTLCLLAWSLQAEWIDDDETWHD